MKVKIRRFAVAEVLPSEMEIEAENGITLLGLVEKLSYIYGTSIRSELLDGEKFKSGILVLVNGRSYEQLKGAATKLNDGDEVFISLMVYGG